MEANLMAKKSTVVLVIVVVAIIIGAGILWAVAYQDNDGNDQLSDSEQALSDQMYQITQTMGAIDSATTNATVYQMQNLTNCVGELSLAMANATGAYNKIALDSGANISNELANITHHTDSVKKILNYTIETPYPIFDDAMGRTNIIKNMPMRVVSASPSTTELIFALGMGSRLVGVTDQCNYPDAIEEAKLNDSIVSIGGYWSPDKEKIVALVPDIVFIGADVQFQKDIIPYLEDFDITVVALYEGKNYTEIRWNIDMVGKSLFCNNAASELKERMTEILDNVKDIIGNQANKPRVMVAVWLEPIFVAGNNTFIQDIIEFAGGVNAFEDMTEFPIVSKEAVLNANPDVIIVAATMMVSDSKSPEDVRSEIMNDVIFQETNAVQDDKVFVMMGQAENSFLRPSVRIADATQLLAKILYPGNFTGTEIPLIIPSDYESLIPNPVHTETATSMEMVQVKA
jgi:iron complex transport system substrate-binding protein